MTDFRNVVFYGIACKWFSCSYDKLPQFARMSNNLQGLQRSLSAGRFFFPFLGCICSITMLYIDFVKLGTLHHCPASLLEPFDVVFVDIVADINFSKSVFLGDFIVGIIVGIQLLLLFLNRVYMGTGIIHLVVAVDSGNIVPQGKR